MIAATRPATAVSQRGAVKLAHLGPVGGEHDQRDDGEGQLQAEHDLAEDEQLGRARCALEEGDAAAGMIATPRVTRRRAHAGMRKLIKPSITVCPAMVAVTVELRPQQSSATANSDGAIGGAEERQQQSVGVAKLVDAGTPGRVERRGGEDEDRGVDGEREHQRHGRVDAWRISSLRASRAAGAIVARLHDAGVEVEIVRHHRGADDAKREIEHLRIA